MNWEKYYRQHEFSPSQYHLREMDNLKPSMRFDCNDCKNWREKLRAKLEELIGGFPSSKVDLNPRLSWRKPHEFGTIEKYILTSEPGSEMPVYLCIPKDAELPCPAMICLQGHTTGMHFSIGVEKENEDREMIDDGDRDFAIGCMKRGIVALCIEQRSFGERGERQQKMVSPHQCHDAVMHSLMLGKTLLGERVFDVDRGIDFLETRKEIDNTRIGVMGNSGGGTVSIYSAALLDRIAFAMPSCSFCTYRDSIMRIYHCSDNYVPGILKYAEMSDVLGLAAPKSLVIVTGAEDPIFPLAAVKKAFADLKEIYKAAGAGERCHLVIGEGGHRFYADKAWKMMLKEVEITGKSV